MFKTARANRFSLSCASAFALVLSSCGGGGGGGVASIPPPPPTPTPTPSPTPTPTPTPAPTVTISAPARASAGLFPAPPVLASQGGPSFGTGAVGTIFPLLQTTLELDGTNIKADSKLNAAGGTATVTNGQFRVQLAGGDFFAPQAYSSLDWTSAGYWSDGGAWDCLPCGRGVFVAGYETPASSMPTSGTATFTGKASGTVYFTVTQGTGELPCSCAEVGIIGDASLTANFGARTVNGSLTNMWAGGDPWNDDPLAQPWNDVAFTSTITGNTFSGVTNVTTAPSGERSLAASATGTVEGRFFGPSAQEAGGIWTLFDGAKAAIGTLIGKRP